MSDFSNPFWSNYVAIATVVSVLACLALLIFTAKNKHDSSQDDGSVGTTGHVYDGIEEMNNPLPLWWVGLFVITIVFGLAYLFMYPGLGSNKGALGWSSEKEFKEETAQEIAQIQPLYAKLEGQNVEDLAKNADARGISERLFLNHCAQCHGSDAQGSKGYPNLTDSDWLHGGTADAIKTSITKGRVGTMPPMAEAVGSAEDIRNLAHYVLKLSNSPHDSIRAGAGKSKFTACVGCHGIGGVGNTGVGAPNLTDNKWLHGYGEEMILDIITKGKVNQMPGQEGRLNEAQIHLLTAYVWGLGGGLKAAAPTSLGAN